MKAIVSWVAAIGATAILALAGAVGVSTPAFAHDELVNTEIIAGADGASPEAVRLTFSNSILEAGTQIVITDTDGTAVTDGEPQLDGPYVTQGLAAGLSAGDYATAWRVVSSDGHPIEGAFLIAIAEDGSAEIRDAASTEEDPGVADEEGEAAEVQDDAAEHSHQDAEATSEGGVGQIVLLVLLVVAAIGVVVTIVVGQRRRSQAIAEQSKKNDEHDEG